MVDDGQKILTGQGRVIDAARSMVARPENEARCF